MSGPLIAVLALLTAVGPLAIDMYLPAFPEMADDLGTSATGIQLTLTTFMLGIGLGQLVIGPLSDGLGRRRPLLVGSVVCLLASIACALAPSVELLATARFVQGLSGAAGVVLARAIISDVSRGPAAARLIGVLAIISVIAPVVAPLVGGGIIALASWRAVFWALAGLVLLMTLGALVFVRETLPPSARGEAGLAATVAAARAVLGNRAYVGYLLTFCLAFAGLFAYIAASPFVVQDVLGLSAGSYSLLFSLNALVITATSALSAALAGRVSYRAMIAVGLGASVTLAAAMLVVVLAGVPTVPTLVLFALFQGAQGLIFGNATALALAESGAHAGTGSAFLGALQFVLAAVMSPLVGVGGEGTAVPMALAMLGSAVLAALAFATLTGTRSGGRDGDRTGDLVETAVGAGPTVSRAQVSGAGLSSAG